MSREPDYKKYPRKLRGKERCCVLSSDGFRCKKTAAIEDSYHGDNEIYYTSSALESVSWVRVALCQEHSNALQSI